MRHGDGQPGEHQHDGHLLAVLVALWWGFVREQGVTVDTNSVAAQFLQSAPIPAKGLPQ